MAVKKILLISLFFIASGFLIAQNTPFPKSIKIAPITKQNIIFYKLTNPNKIVKLKQGRSIVIYYSDTSQLISIITGKIYSKNDSVLYIYGAYDTKEYPIASNANTTKQNFMYPPNFDYPSDSIIGINFKNISYLIVEDYSVVSAVSCVTPIISALIIGPLISIDYSNRTFNSEQYREILYPSIGLLAGGLLWTLFWHNHWNYCLTVKQ
jgi:hypothetical protein